MNPPAHPPTLAACLAMLSTAAAAHAQQTVILYVDDDAPAGGNGQSWGTAFRDLQDAFWVAERRLGPDSVGIRIAAGVYRPDRGTGLREASFRLRNDDYTFGSGMTLSMIGAFAGLGAPDPDARDLAANETILSGDLLGNDESNEVADNSFLVVDIQAGHASLEVDGITVTGAAGYEGGWGYAAQLGYYSNDTVIRNCQFAGNHIGGLLTSGALIEACRFSGNTGGEFDSGGVEVQGGSASILRDCEFVANSGGLAGAVHIPEWGGSVFVERCRFLGNNSLTGTGALNALSYRIQISDSLFAGNAGRHGGALETRDDTMLVNCTMTGNAARYGGALLYDGPMPFHNETLIITNCILWNNSAEMGGDSIASTSPDAVIEIYASLLESGEEGIYGYWDSLTLDIDPEVTHPDFADPDGPDNIPGTFTDNNYELLASSPCVDRGRDRSYGSGPFDLAGNPRTSDGDGDYIPRIDIGCYEFQSPYCSADTDHDGFVTGLDFDEYTWRFESGDIRADFDADGFVTGLDFDAYIAAFQAGC